MLVLAIDTSNAILSVALVEDNKKVIEITEVTKNNQSERLMPVIETMFKDANRSINEVSLIAVAEGPGSYTGVRVGVTVAKTLAWTLKKPLVGISSLEVLAQNIEVDGLIIPIFDARRETVFAAAYDGKSYEPIIPEGHYVLKQLLTKLEKLGQKAYFIGSDVNIHWEIITEILDLKAEKIEDETLNIPHGTILANIACLREPEKNIHSFAPKYHRLPEAEVNWLKAQKENTCD